MAWKLIRRAAAAVMTIGVAVGGLALSPATADAGGVPHHQSATTDATADAGTPASARGDTPPGANGTIKIETSAAPATPANAPHVACHFWVSFFGFDSGTDTAHLVFSGQAPTRSSTLRDTKTSWTATRPAGDHLDATFGPVDLMPAIEAAGVTPTRQGYHIRLTATVTGGGHTASKSKVFWLTPCAAPAAAPAGVTTEAAKPAHVLAAAVAAPSAGPTAPAVTAPSLPSDSRVAAAGVADMPATVAAGRLGLATPSSAPSGAASRAGVLPFTGMQLSAFVLLAALLCGSGLFLRRLGRRRPQA